MWHRRTLFTLGTPWTRWVHTLFCSVDLASGYWQIWMGEKDKSKTAFTTHRGLYQFSVIPLGCHLHRQPTYLSWNWCPLSCHLHRQPSHVSWTWCCVDSGRIYLDDIIVFGGTFGRRYSPNYRLLTRSWKQRNATCFWRINLLLLALLFQLIESGVILQRFSCNEFRGSK